MLLAIPFTECWQLWSAHDARDAAFCLNRLRCIGSGKWRKAQRPCSPLMSFGEVKHSCIQNVLVYFMSFNLHNAHWRSRVWYEFIRCPVDSPPWNTNIPRVLLINHLRIPTIFFPSTEPASISFHASTLNARQEEVSFSPSSRHLNPHLSAMCICANEILLQLAPFVTALSHRKCWKFDTMLEGRGRPSPEYNPDN